MTRESYAAEQAAQRARVECFAAGVAAELDGWAAEPNDHGGWHLVNADGVRVWLSLVTYGAGAGRITVAAGVPDDASYSDGDYSGIERPEITVSPDRAASAVAKDVARRLLPAAVDYWEAVSGRVARRLARANSRETLARELADIMGSAVSGPRGRDEWKAETPDALRRRESYTYGDMTPSHDASEVTVELRNITPDEARELAAMIARWAK